MTEVIIERCPLCGKSMLVKHMLVLMDTDEVFGPCCSRCIQDVNEDDFKVVSCDC